MQEDKNLFNFVFWLQWKDEKLLLFVKEKKGSGKREKTLELELNECYATSFKQEEKKIIDYERGGRIKYKMKNCCNIVRAYEFLNKYTKERAHMKCWFQLHTMAMHGSIWIDLKMLFLRKKISKWSFLKKGKLSYVRWCRVK